MEALPKGLCCEKRFINDQIQSAAQREPVENVVSVSRDVAKLDHMADKVGSITLQAPQSTSREASVERATIIKFSCDEGMDKSGGSRSSEYCIYQFI